MSRLRTNFASGQLFVSVSDSATTLTSAAFANLPVVASPDTLEVTLDPEGTAGAPEIVWVTAHTAAATSVTVARGKESTTARAHLAGVDWVHAPTAADFHDDGFIVAALDSNAADNTAALQAAVDEAYTASKSVMILPVPADATTPYYQFTGSVNLAGKAGTHIFGGGGRRQLGFSTSPQVELANVTNANPIFVCDGDAVATTYGGFKFENLALYGVGLFATATRGVSWVNCSLLGHATGGTIQVENSFWWKFVDCGFLAASASAPNIILRGRAGGVDENISYLMEWHNCTFKYTGVRYEQHDNYAPNGNPAKFMFIGCDTENFTSDAADGALMSLLRTGSMTDTLTVEQIIVDQFEHYDTSGTTSVPLVSSPSGTKVTRVYARAAVVRGEYVRTEVAPIDIVIVGNPTGASIARTAAHAAINQLSTAEVDGEWLYRGSTGTPTGYGFAARYGTDTVRRWGVRGDGQHEWGDGTNAVDTNLYRGAADVLQTDDRLKSAGLLVNTNATTHAAGEVGRFDGRIRAIVFENTDGITAARWLQGSGSPEAAVTGSPGWFYSDVTNGEMYIKKTGTGNTGWKLVTHA